jgi:hypothetical protein
MEDQGETAVVEDIQPHETVGSGFRLAGLLIHDFTVTSDETPSISVDGYPPSFASGTREPIDYVVDAPCPVEPEGPAD